MRSRGCRHPLCLLQRTSAARCIWQLYFTSICPSLCLCRLRALRFDRSNTGPQGDVKDTLKDAGSTIKDKVSGAADDAEGNAKSAGTPRYPHF